MAGKGELNESRWTHVFARYPRRGRCDCVRSERQVQDPRRMREVCDLVGHEVVFLGYWPEGNLELGKPRASLGYINCELY